MCKESYVTTFYWSSWGDHVVFSQLKFEITYIEFVLSLLHCIKDNSRIKIYIRVMLCPYTLYCFILSILTTYNERYVPTIEQLCDDNVYRNQHQMKPSNSGLQVEYVQFHLTCSAFSF